MGFLSRRRRNIDAAGKGRALQNSNAQPGENVLNQTEGAQFDPSQVISNKGTVLNPDIQDDVSVLHQNVQSNETVLNPSIQDKRVASNTDVRNNATVLNPNVQGRHPVENPYGQNIGTVLNPNVQISGSARQKAFIGTGTILCEKYVVEERLDVSTGEAELFLCNYNGTRYIAKVYRRYMAVKPDVAQSLSQIYSPYVAHIFDIGEYDGYPVEILPYYRNGSLQGQTFSISQLRENIIPSLNAGLKVLHDNGIIHKDLKPSNIMLNDDGRTVSIIDFGISTIAPNGSTVVVTHTGLTPEYSAPETFRGLFLIESDYYALGITLFELYTGHSPYDGMTQEQIAQFAVIQKVPLPKNMDAGLRKLITGLTYNDITNRKDKDNPNRRWTYVEVNNWLSGIPQPIPGVSAADSAETGEFRAYRFQGHSYNTMDGLVTALAKSWESGKKQLFRGTLGGHFNSIDAEIASICCDAQDELDEGRKSDDFIFFETLLRMSTGTPKLFWKGHVFENLDDFAERLLTGVRENRTDMDELVNDMLTSGVLSAFIENVNPDAREQINALRAFETAHRTFGSTGRRKLAERYQLGFMLSTEKTLVVNGMSFHNADELVEHMKRLLNQSYELFDAFSRQMIHENDELDLQFECWLIAQGKKQAIEEWRREMMA